MPHTDYPVYRSIARLTEYLGAIQEIQREWSYKRPYHFPFNLWFRGQTEDWPLLPKVFRASQDPRTGALTFPNEMHILEAFTALYRNYIAERFEEKSIELLAFMQHQAVPTRFLDWTESALMALYFAVAGSTPARQETAVVWIMAPGSVNTLAVDKTADISGPLLASTELVQARVKMIGYANRDGSIHEMFWINYREFKRTLQHLLRHPVAFYPTSCNNLRLATQKGCFTVHGTAQVPIEQLLHGDVHQEFLRKVSIPGPAAWKLREELKVMGITPRSVFPDLTGLAQELNGEDYYVSASKVVTVSPIPSLDDISHS